MNSNSWIKKLSAEIKHWVSDGLINPDQEARIISRYSGATQYRRLINTITTLGSILVGLGILLFVASNWDKLAPPAKISIIFSVILLFNLASYYFRYIKKGYPGLTEGFLLIGAFSFGAGIWLIAQIYQIHYNFSAGILFWILGILPIVLIYRSWTVLCLSAILSMIWLYSYQGYYLQREAYGFLLLLSVIVLLAYFKKQRFSLFLMIITLASWLGSFWFLKYSKGNYFSETSVLPAHLLLVVIYMLLGFILYGLGVEHLKSNRFTAFSFLYKSLGVLFITLSTYSVTFAHHYYKYSGAALPPAIVILIGILATLSIFIFLGLYISSQEDKDLKEIRLVFCFLVSGLFAALISLNLPKASSLSFNIILVAETLGFMYLGFLRHSEGIFRLSIAIFFLNILSRYFDIFWKMLPRSLLFILGGVFLILGAIFIERKRREIETKMRNSETA